MRSVREVVARFALGVEGLVRPRTKADARLAQSVLMLEYMLPLGSCVHMTPVYEAVKKARPEIILTVATRGLGSEVLRHSPFINYLIETPDPLKELGATVTSLREQLKQRSLEPDCALTGASDQRTRIALLGVGVCAGWRGGFTVQSGLYQRPLVYDAARSLIANNLRVAEMLGCDGGLLEPSVFFSAEEVTRARGLIDAAQAGGAPVLIVVSQNSGGQRTGWHADRFIEVVQYAHGVLGYAVIYVGTAREAATIERLRVRAATGVSVAGETDVSTLAALLALSDMVLSLDTGTMHVARAVGVPMVVLGPSWQKPLEWLPLGKPHVRILRGEDRTGAPEGYQLDEISVIAVEEALEELTRLYPASEKAREQRIREGLSEIDLLVRRERYVADGLADAAV